MTDIREYLSSASAEPGKILRGVITLSSVLIIIWLLLVTRMEIYGRSPAEENTIQSRADSLRSVLLHSAPDTEGVQRIPPPSSGPFPGVFTTFLLLAAMLAGAWWWIRRNPGTGASSRRYSLIGSIPLATGARIQILEMYDEVWVLGVSTGAVQLLHRYPMEEWIGKGGEPGPAWLRSHPEAGGGTREGQGGGPDGGRLPSAGPAGWSFKDFLKGR